jgi:hypothetical protein
MKDWPPSSTTDKLASYPKSTHRLKREVRFVNRLFGIAV